MEQPARATSDNWWIIRRAAKSELRPALEGITRYIGTVDTSTNRVFEFIDSEILVDDGVVIVATAAAEVLAILSSRIHVLFSLRAGGWLESATIQDGTRASYSSRSHSRTPPRVGPGPCALPKGVIPSKFRLSSNRMVSLKLICHLFACIFATKKAVSRMNSGLHAAR